MPSFQALLSTELRAGYTQGLIHRMAVQWPKKRRRKAPEDRQILVGQENRLKSEEVDLKSVAKTIRRDASGTPR